MTPPKHRPEAADSEAPEADAQWFARAKAAAEVLPSLFGEAAATELLKSPRGRPRSLTPKTHVNIRLDADIVQAFKATGSGWQTRLNEALREWLAKR